jgi:hypothetical protein
VPVLEGERPGLDEAQQLRLDVPVQAGRLEERDEVVDERARGDLEQEVVPAVLDAYISELCARVSVDTRLAREWARTLSARSCTFGFLWFRRRLSAPAASLAGSVLDRIWSHISRLSAMFSAPAGRSSDVALSVAGVSYRCYYHHYTLH